MKTRAAGHPALVLTIVAAVGLACSSNGSPNDVRCNAQNCQLLTSCNLGLAGTPDGTACANQPR